MKINQLSKITGVNAETIRMYRKLGLLRPARLENGYYDYSVDDLRNLLNIRKLRGAGLGLDNIEYMYNNADYKEVYDAIRGEYDALSAQIEALRRQQAMLKLTLDHFALYRDDPGVPVELTVDDDSYSVFSRGAYDGTAAEWLRRIDLMTQSLRIPKEALLSPELPEMLPTELGIGTYSAIIKEHGLEIPPSAVCIPKGKYLTAWVTPEETDRISSAQIRPLLTYAKEHGYRLTGDSTAFLYRVDHIGDKIKFIYRFRVRVEKE